MLHFCVEKCFCVKFDILIDVLVKSGEVKVNCGANAGAIESVSVAIDHGFLRKKNERNINNRSQKDALSLIHVELVRQSGRSFVVGAAYLHEMPLYFINSIAFENEKKVQFIINVHRISNILPFIFAMCTYVLPLCILVIYSLDMSKTISHFSFYFTSCSLRVTHTLARSLFHSLSLYLHSFAISLAISIILLLKRTINYTNLVL